ncbi:hypothetical protein MMC13_006940 [Lambiella insularis]|nr:hypothetical protein [Lambiella insularis]
MHRKTSDVESMDEGCYVRNETVHSFSWNALNVQVYDKVLGSNKTILQDIQGCVRAGEMLALMGPSGCGKSSLLDILAHRPNTSKFDIKGDIFVNGIHPSSTAFRKSSSYVEQEDNMIGSLTAKETLYFAAKLALPSSVSSEQRTARVEELLTSFGLLQQANTIVGTPLRKGLSGGQKRRLGIACAMITCPKILFLDEPTSGLDSHASYQVISYIQKVAKAKNIIVVMSIHQPSTLTFRCFDKLLLLSGGTTCYFGNVDKVDLYFAEIGIPMPMHFNPAEFLLDIVNIDFSDDLNRAAKRLQRIQSAWLKSPESLAMAQESLDIKQPERHVLNIHSPYGRSAESLAVAWNPVDPYKWSPQELFELDFPPGPNAISIPITLLHRNFLKSYRDVVAYGIRLAMYTGLALLMGTVWLRLDTSQQSIQPFINAIFFGSAFMSFMAVAYVPAFLEDRAIYTKERANGLYGPGSFMLANFLIGVPYLFVFSFLFSTIAYWLSNFHPTGTAFFSWIAWLYLDLLAAESLVVLVASLCPNLILSLAMIAFANGLWMSVGGFLVTPTILNVFYKYVFSYIDYQAYVFQGMMVNEFVGRNYTCGPPPCDCMYQTDLAPMCLTDGKSIVEGFGYDVGDTGQWVGTLLAIVVGYRLLGYLVLLIKRT